jgi:CHAD domain-containing protein
VTSYRLHQGENVGEATVRIVEDLAREARTMLAGAAALNDPTTAEATAGVADAIHEARKCCKKVRGLVRLVRPALGDAYDVANQRFRDAARCLSTVRDHEAVVEICDALIVSAPDLRAGVGAETVRRELAERSHATARWVVGPGSARIQTARRLIAEGAAPSATWEIPDGFGPMAGGFAKTYTRARNGYLDADALRTVEVFHEWRKRVKYLWYQVLLVVPAAPSVLEPLAGRLHDLSDTLGDTHDLAVLVETVGGLDADRDQAEAVAAAARGRMVDLEDRAIRLGARLFVEAPDDFVSRMAGYWEAWQDGPERPVGELGERYPADDDLGDLTFDELYRLARTNELVHRSLMSRDELEATLRAAGAS